MVDLRGLEVSRWIVESQMAIFTDANHRQIDGGLGPKSIGFGDHFFWAFRSVQEMKRTDGDFVYESSRKVATKTGWMGAVQSQVFIQMKSVHPVPVYADCLGQVFQDFKLT